jgi:hypothetical protein
MNRDNFWNIVEAACAQVADTVESVDEVAEAVIDTLASVPLAQIVEFSDQYDVLAAESYRSDLWAAAYLINGGCSDDNFDYFRGWLIGQGRATYEAALADPDSLARLFEPGAAGDVDGESMLAAASTAYERATGDPEAFWVALKNGRAAPGYPAISFDFDFDDETEMRTRLPRLAAIFLGEE